LNPTSPKWPLPLLVQVNMLHAWRRLKGIQRQSRLLSLLIFSFIIGYLVLAFWLFKLGLGFLKSFPGLGVLLTERLLFLLFAFLFGLLLLSNLVISYTNFFRNRETVFLQSLPVSAQTIFRWKFLESGLLASWAFIFLVAPLLAAFGLNQNVAWHFYPVTLGLIGLFIVLPGVAGAWLAVTLARFLDRRTFQIFTIAGAITLLIGAFFWLRTEPVSEEIMEYRVLAVLDRLLLKTRFAQFPLLPSYWLSQSVLQWSEGALRAAAFFILVLLSHVLFFGYLMFTQMGKRFYEAFSIVHSRESAFGQWKWFQILRARRKIFTYPQSLGEKLLQNGTGLTTDVRALILKDARMFWRDTTQWGQTAVLFGLLGVYIINLRHFSQQLTSPFWVHLVSYLNLGACSLNLATLTTRFVYPQFSLEGKRLWIVGMAPLGLKKVVKTKFWMASISSLILTTGLIWLSCYMLKMPLDRTMFFAATIAVMTFTLNGLAIGLGTLYPNFKEDNPSKIVSGFGGTFCLVLSFLYIVGSVSLLAVGSPWGWKGQQSFQWVLLSWIGFAMLSILVGQVPFQIGLRRLGKFEM
jgi:ABC-2 type transport system permease protein